LQSQSAEFSGLVIRTVETTLEQILFQLQKEQVAGEFFAECIRFRRIELHLQTERVGRSNCGKWQNN